MNKKLEEEVASIEATQGALRDSIEQSKLLSDQVDKLVKKHKASLKKEAKGLPSD